MTRSRALHVDPDPRYRTALREAVESVDLATVGTAAEALRTLEAGDLDLLVCEAVSLPDGTSLVAAAREAVPSVTVVLFTDRPWEAVADDVAATNVVNYVRKHPPSAVEADAVGRRIDRLAAPDGPTAPPYAVDGGASPPPAGSRPDGFPDGEGWRTLARFRWDEVDELAVTIVTAVERLLGEGDGPPLYESVNAEALEELLRPAPGRPLRSGARFSFPYRGHELAVVSNGLIAIRPLEE